MGITFISCCSLDRPWGEWIAWVLEDAGFPTFIQAWDFLPGHNFVLKMHQAVESADRVVAVLSPHFLKSKYTQSEWSTAFAKDPEGNERKLLLVCVQKCDVPGILKQIVRIDLYKNCWSESQAKKTLLDGLSPGRKKPKVPPVFPGSQQGLVSKKPNFPADTRTDDAQTRKKYLNVFTPKKWHRVKFAICLMLLSGITVFIGSPTFPPWKALIAKITHHINEIDENAGEIVFPFDGAVVSGQGTVRFRISIRNTYAAIILRPLKDGQFYIQNDGLTIFSSDVQTVRVFYGGRDQYQIYLAVTHDPNLFKVGSKLTQLPLNDRFNQPVLWIGPVNVSHL